LQSQPAGQQLNAFDAVRRKYLGLAVAHTGRSTIVYATAWQQNPGAPAPLISVADEDMLGFMEAVHGLPGPNLDLILHSPGGSGSAAEQIVKYLRTKFDHIRIIVPHMAMSAATMIATAADQIVMGKHSFLGPINPQVIMQTALGPRSIPAQAILEQFERAQREAVDPAKLRVWAPMLAQYGPDLLVSCQNAAALSENLVSDWLQRYMFKGDPDASAKGAAIAQWLSDHNQFKTHARPLARDELHARGLNIASLEQHQTEQDLFLSIHHAVTHTFTSTQAVKLIENHLGKAYVRAVSAVQPIQIIQAPPPPFPPVPSQPAQRRSLWRRLLDALRG
jgi:Serine dehydrogenase proteinase